MHFWKLSKVILEFLSWMEWVTNLVNTVFDQKLGMTIEKYHPAYCEIYMPDLKAISTGFV